jgi:hypothetical protein
MSHEQPAKDCAEVPLREPLALEPPAEVALEDYARALSGARSADAVHESDRIVGVHLCGLPAPLTGEARKDLVDFASELRDKIAGGGLGWS